MLEITQKNLEVKKFLGWSGLIILVLIAATFYFNGKISATAREIQDKKSQIQALKNREENIWQLQKDYYVIEPDITNVTDVLLDEENVAQFVRYLEELASLRGVNIEIAFDEKANLDIEKNKYLVFNLNISGSGTTAQQYWKSLEEGPYFVEIDSFNFNTEDGLGSNSQLKLSARVYTNDPYSVK